MLNRDPQDRDNSNIPQLTLEYTCCDNCSDCSSLANQGEEYCSTCNNSHIDTSFACEHNEEIHCSMAHHATDLSLSLDMSSHVKCDHCHHSSYRLYHHHNHSEGSSWQEELKSVSSTSDGNSSVSYNNRYYKNQNCQTDNDLHSNYNHPVLPFSTTLKSFQSSNNIAKEEKSRKKRCCCFCKNRTYSRLTVFLVFFLFILGAFAAFFCWPRTPRVSMGGGADSLSGPPDWWAREKQPLPPSDTPIPARPSLRATWQINVTLDNRDNWVPTHLNQLDFVMVDSLTLAKFAWATTNTPLILSPGTITPVSLTFDVLYQAADRTDPTFQNLYNACGPISDSKQRPALNVLLRTSFHIFGILWTPLVTATPYTGGILCPTK